MSSVKLHSKFKHLRLSSKFEMAVAKGLERITDDIVELKVQLQNAKITMEQLQSDEHLWKYKNQNGPVVVQLQVWIIDKILCKLLSLGQFEMTGTITFKWRTYSGNIVIKRGKLRPELKCTDYQKIIQVTLSDRCLDALNTLEKQSEKVGLVKK